MRIQNLQSTYIQKSRIFLYPLLGIRRGVSVTPVDTFMTWDDTYKINDYKFIVTYHLRDDKDFKEFEESKLLGNTLFHDFFELDDDLGVYIFDFASMRTNYKKIVNGKYSLLDDEYKRKVLNFFKNHHRHHLYILSYLNPEKYFNDYAKLLNVKPSLLEGVGELCSLPNLEMENLQMSKKVVNFESVNNL